MISEQAKAALEATAAERAGTLKSSPPAITLESLHARLTAIENHPALKRSAKEQSNG